jgi:tRNA pseudouridine55 synthase
MLVDKPMEWTSFDVVKKVRWALRVRKVGHAGTLDPKATGLLILGIGAGTKALTGISDLEKEYIGSFELGIRTASFDSETDVTERHDWSGVSATDIKEAASSFIGEQVQIPPMYSAVKQGGRPLYTYARAGKVLPREGRRIRITEFEIVNILMPRVDFRVVCSKGTYIRTLVDDLGQKLGVGASVTSLRRTRVGAYRVEDALHVENLTRENFAFAQDGDQIHEAGARPAGN